jgi:hypothetical protein
MPISLGQGDPVALKPPGFLQCLRFKRAISAVVLVRHSEAVADLVSSALKI